MVRTPCCEKLGLKRGIWSKEEDNLLIKYIEKNGHSNWRALPKLAGLLRCGKSCRLRWTNYLRPDIKRGNFTHEEEETIIKMHQDLGNRWSIIATKLPGRTDNEIKNIWHTRLKKKVTNESPAQEKSDLHSEPENSSLDIYLEPENSNLDLHLEPEINNSDISSSPNTNIKIQQQPSTSVYSSSLTSSSSENSCLNTTTTSWESSDQIMLDNLLEVDDNFWSEVICAVSVDNSNLDIHLEPEINNSKDNSNDISSSPNANNNIQQQPSTSVHSSSSSSENSCLNATATSSKSSDQIMLDNLLEVDDNFWSEVLCAVPIDNDNTNNNINDNNLDLSLMEESNQNNSSLNDNWFWDDLLSRSNELVLELPEL